MHFIFMAFMNLYAIHKIEKDTFLKDEVILRQTPAFFFLKNGQILNM